MGCGCGKKSRLPAAQPQRWAALVDQTYMNATGETLSSRNPRFELAPGDSVTLTPETISHIVRGWIRSGALELVPEVVEFEVPELVAPKKKTPAAKKAAAKIRPEARLP